LADPINRSFGTKNCIGIIGIPNSSICIISIFGWIGIISIFGSIGILGCISSIGIVGI
jgi:hypothetical protein